MDDINTTIFETGLVPVIKLDDAANAVMLGKTLVSAGLPVAEVTFRTAAAEESIRRICAECPGLLVGAGTVTSPARIQSRYGGLVPGTWRPGFSRGQQSVDDRGRTSEGSQGAQIFPRRGFGRYRDDRCPGRSIRRGQVHSDRRHQHVQPRFLRFTPGRTRNRRQLDGQAGTDPVGAVGRHRNTVFAGSDRRAGLLLRPHGD